jgi:hypothetical protein
MTQIATTIEQSKRLMELGVPVETADMCYIFTDENGENISSMEVADAEEDGHEITTSLQLRESGNFDYSYATDVPAWSLSALIDVLPKHINDHTAVLSMEIFGCVVVAGYKTEKSMIVCHQYADIYDAAIDLLQWLKYNHIKS